VILIFHSDKKNKTMKNKKMYYVIGGIAVLGIGYYLWNKSKKSAEVKEATDETTKNDLGTDAPAPTPTPAPAPVTAPVTAPKQLTAQELESKLQSDCGKKPLLKKNMALYNKCRENTTAKLKKERKEKHFFDFFPQILHGDFFLPQIQEIIPRFLAFLMSQTWKLV
jgi:hypothetical protein